ARLAVCGQVLDTAQLSLTVTHHAEGPAGRRAIVAIAAHGGHRIAVPVDRREHDDATRCRCGRQSWDRAVLLPTRCEPRAHAAAVLAADETLSGWHSPPGATHRRKGAHAERHARRGGIARDHGDLGRRRHLPAPWLFGWIVPGRPTPGPR